MAAQCGQGWRVRFLISGATNRARKDRRFRQARPLGSVVACREGLFGSGCAGSGNVIASDSLAASELSLETNAGYRAARLVRLRTTRTSPIKPNMSAARFAKVEASGVVTRRNSCGGPPPTGE